MGRGLLFLVIVLGAIAIACLLSSRTIKNQFKYLGNVYRLDEGGSRGELNEECLQHPSYRMCMLTDGTSGVCALSGMCVADMSVDHRKERDAVPRPLCTAPIFKEGCGRWCNCQKMKGSNNPGCRSECESWFSPI